MRRPETREAFEARKERDFARWRRNSEDDPRERDARDDGYHPRFRDPRRDPRLADDDDGEDGEDDPGGG